MDINNLDKITGSTQIQQINIKASKVYEVMSQITSHLFLPNLYFLETTEGGKGEGKTINSGLNQMQQKNLLIYLERLFLMLLKKN